MGGKYTAYPEYKDSGVEWVGDVPEGWKVAQLSTFTNKITNGYVGPTRDIFVQNGVRYLQSLHIKNGKIDFYKPYFVSKEWSLGKKKSILGIGDVLIVQTGDIGQVAPVTHEYVGCNCHALIIVSSTKDLDGFYLAYLLNSDYGNGSLKSIQTGALHPHLNCDCVKNIKISIPSVDEQTQIANFLDHETAKIDLLIEKQEKLIELLKEKRQAVISHAVTKGLNPDAPMKDSGVEWLGEVPEHWGVTKLGFLGSCQNGLNIGGDAFGSGYPFVSYGDVYKTLVLPKTGSGLVCSSFWDRESYSVQYGDTFFTRTSETIEEIGFASTCLSTIENATFAGFLIRFRPKTGLIDPNYSKYYFRNQKLRAFFVKEMNLVTRASLSQELLKRMLITIPPVVEQQVIADYLDEKERVFSRLIEKIESAIVLIKERRTALISAAVTGKIDVRNWQPSSKES